MMEKVDRTVVGFDPYTYQGSPNVRVTDGYLVMLLSTLGFAAVNYLVQVIGPPRNMDGDIWRWRNTVVSWVHAILIGIGSMYCSLFKSHMFDDMLLFCDSFTYSLLAASCGYFVFDFIDFIINKRALRDYAVTVHHILAIALCWHQLQYMVMMPITIIALNAEVNSIFLHARKLMQYGKWSFNHWLYQGVVVLNIVTFIRYRLYAVYFILASIYHHLDSLTVAYSVYITICIILMGVINVILFWRLFNNDVLRHFKSSKSDRKSIHSNSNNSNNGFNYKDKHL